MSHSPDVKGAIPKLPPQSTPSTQQSLVQVPPDLLRNLIAKVAQLERSQEASIAALRDEVAQLQASAGVTFSRFSKLPEELRDMIWDFALKAPQIHIMRGEDISRSKVNDVMQACSEARNRGLMLKKPYYQVGKVRIRDSIIWDPYEFLPTAPKFYMNLDVDTFWVGQQHQFLPDCVRYVCGACDHEIGDRLVRRPSGFQNSVIPTCQHKISLRRLAIHYKMWTDFWPNGSQTVSAVRQAHFLILLRSMNPEELLIVVGNIDCARDRHVRFVPPSQKPCLMMPKRESFSVWVPLRQADEEWRSTPGDSWDVAAEKMESNLELFKNRCGEKRRHLLEVHGNYRETMYSPDLSEWQVPKVKYVEVISGDRNWIRPKKRFYNDEW